MPFPTVSNFFKEHAKGIAIYAAIGTFWTVVQPFGLVLSDTFFGNWLFWTGLTCLGGIVGSSTSNALRKYTHQGKWYIHLAITPLSVSAAISIAILALFPLFYHPIPLHAVGNLFLSIWVISIAVTSFLIALERAGIKPSAAPDQPLSETAPDTALADLAVKRFMKRLPLRFHHAQLFAIVSEDHYLRVYTHMGDELILMRLSDAIDELAGVNGLQTHRSWWVAYEGLQDIQRDNGKTKINLKNGIEVPVSRPNVRKLKEKNWL